MKEKDVYSELSSIRELMERSTKFISLSGMAGVMAGIYALIGAFLAYKIAYRESSIVPVRDFYLNDPVIWSSLIFIALGVLILSVATAIWLTIRKATRKGENYWNSGSKRLIMNMVIPLFTGGLFILVLLIRGEYSIIVPATLIFYGLSLVSGSHYTFTDVKWLGFFQISLGLLAALMPGYGLILWMFGFGILHIIYGSIMHFKYDR